MPSGSGSENSPTVSATVAAILSALGVSEYTNPPDLVVTSQSGEEVTIDDPDEWNPLGAEYAVFSPKSEDFPSRHGERGLYRPLLHLV